MKERLWQKNRQGFQLKMEKFALEVVELLLGVFRTKTRELDNRLNIRLSVYDDIEWNENGFIELELDIVTEDSIYLRGVKNG